MSFSELPNGIVYLIVYFLDYENEVDAPACINRGLHSLVNSLLYQHNVRHGHSSALAWGIIHGFMTTVRMSLDEGAPINVCNPVIDWTPVALAAIHGQGAIARLLVYDYGMGPSPKKGWGNPLSDDYCDGLEQ